jgi:2'-5' RNA ligase
LKINLTEWRVLSGIDDEGSHDPAPLSEAYKGDGIMVALWPNASLKDYLVKHVPKGGEDPEDLHMTLVFLGTTEEHDEESLARARATVRAWARATSPMAATIQGPGRFTTPSGQKDVVYANVDAPSLPDARADLVRRLRSARVSFKENHGFTPHITLAYIEQNQPTRPLRIAPVQSMFSKVVLAVGGKQEHFTLGK